MNSSFTPSQQRPALHRRMRQRLFMAMPALVWLGAVTAVAVMLWHREPTASIKCVAEASTWRLCAPVAAELLAIHVQANETVTSGQVIAQFQDAALRLRLARARADLDGLRAEMRARQTELEHQALASEHNGELRRMHRDLEDAELDVLQAKADLEETSVRMRGAAIELQRQKPLEGQGIAAEATLNLLQTNHDALAKRTTELASVIAGHDRRVSACRQRLEEMGSKPQPPAGGSTELLAPFQWRIKAAETELEQITFLLSRHTLVAPSAGVVETVQARSGEWLDQGQCIVTIVERKPARLVAYVPQELSAKLDVTQSVLLESAGRRSMARVLTVAPTVTPLPRSLWTHPDVAEHGIAVSLEPTGQEIPGQRLSVHLK